MFSSSTLWPLGYGTAAAELTENLWYLCTVLINAYVASPDPNPTGGVNYLTLRVQFYANECNEGRDAHP